jgi:predicted AAA+ superfamily ATPase
MFELPPVTFTEFCNYKTAYRYESRLEKYFDMEADATRLLLNEYMLFGGYPRLVTQTTRDEKLHTLDEIYRAHTERDITGLIGAERPEAYVKLMKLLASQHGQLVNFSNLSNMAGLNQQTVKKYMFYAEKTFFIHLVYPYFTNIGKEITKSPMVYFNDIGIRNYQLGVSEINPGEGFTFQNLVYMQLRQKTEYTGATINYWRTTDKAEVDFVVERQGKPMPVEVKFSVLKKPEITRSLRSFIAKYQPAKAWVINLGFTGNMQVDGTEVEFIPYKKLVFKEL